MIHHHTPDALLTDHTVDSDELPVHSTDEQLLAATRAGDRSAFSELWTNHRSAAYAYARSLTSTFDPDDVVSEAFVRIMSAIRNGKGPERFFHEYLRRSIRTTIIEWSRKPVDAKLEDFTWANIPDDTGRFDALDSIEVVSVFKSLPATWQQALWNSEVLGMKADEIAETMDKSIGATYILLFRARNGLREAWARTEAA